MSTPLTYLVGGAVRDEILNKPVKDRDWVVVGATPELMLSQGYKQVGADFPVFLHPETAEEHALARQERKTAPGHRGFVVHASPEVTLEEDLSRRDLTMNAIAKALDGTIIDPFNGTKDITDRVIRHVGPAFSEDPLRILRVARFAARYPDFTIAPETLKLMKNMVHRGALNELSGERVIGELDKSLKTESPSRFFEVLRQVDADIALFSHEFHVKEIASAFEGIDSTRIDNSWLFSLAFERSGLSLFQTTSLGIRYKIPKEYSQNLQMLQHFEKDIVANPLNPNTHWDAFLKSDGVRRPERFVDFLNLLETQHPLCFAGVKDAVSKVQTIHFGESLKNIPPAERSTYVNEVRKDVFLSTWFSEPPKKRKP